MPQQKNGTLKNKVFSLIRIPNKSSARKKCCKNHYIFPDRISPMRCRS